LLLSQPYYKLKSGLHTLPNAGFVSTGSFRPPLSRQRGGLLNRLKDTVEPCKSDYC